VDYPVVVEWDSLSSVALATRHPDGEVCGHIIIPDSSCRCMRFRSSLRRVLIGLAGDKASNQNSMHGCIIFPCCSL
jgi:hypothetical protein